MSKIDEYLEFDFSATSFQISASNIMPKILSLKLNQHINDLAILAEKLGNKSFTFLGSDLIPQTYRKTKAALANSQNLSAILNRRELRTLTFALNYSEYKQESIFQNTEDLDIILKVAENNWRDTFLIGLFDCYMKSWDSINTKSKEILGTYILGKLSNYNGNRSVLRSLKSNAKYFNQNNGDVTLGAELALKKYLIRETTKYLSLPENYFTYPYFSKVILAFYEKSKGNAALILEDLNIALELHNNSITNKRIISKLIIQANTNEFINLQDSVKSIAFKYIGDPGISVNWLSYHDATNYEVNELRIAKEILNEWITRQFINVFFERCINDNRRKRFWLKYAKQITAFKFFGPSHIKRMLKSDQRIKEYVDGRFHVVGSTKNVSAFMFILKEYKLIEFSDPGYAFYAYKTSNSNAPSMENSTVYSVDSFRDGNKPLLVYRSGSYFYKYKDEGRLSHADGVISWEDVFSIWLSKIAGIDV